MSASSRSDYAEQDELCNGGYLPAALPRTMSSIQSSNGCDNTILGHILETMRPVIPYNNYSVQYATNGSLTKPM